MRWRRGWGFVDDGDTASVLASCNLLGVGGLYMYLFNYSQLG